MKHLLWATCSISFILLIIGLLEHRNKQRMRQSSTENDNPSPTGEEYLVSKRSISQNKHPTSEEHRATEQRYWRWQVGTSIPTLIFAAIAAAGSVWAYVEAKRQADAAVEAASAASEQAENMDRPWIKLVDLLHPDIRFVGPGMAMQFGFPGERPEVSFNVTPHLKNVGKTTAIHVHVQASLVIHKWANEWANFSLEQAEACSNAQKMEKGYDATLFPDDPFDQFGVGNSVLLSEENVSVSGATRYIAPAIVGCVDYQFSSSKRHHQTKFVYEMFRADNRSRIFIVGQDATEHDITLIRDPQSDYAD